MAPIHQEDLCQAMGLHPSARYEDNGGTSAGSIAKLLQRTMSSREAERAVWRFADALAWNWLVAGTDAHTKNYSLLLNRRDIRLAPLYDVSSILPYLDERGPDGEIIQARRVRMAMKIGGEYKLEPPGDTWRAAVSDPGLPAVEFIARVAALADSVPSTFAAAADSFIADLQTEVIAKLVETVSIRARRCAEILG